MKKTVKCLFASAALFILLTGCVQFQNMTVPKKVQVKTTAEYNFTIAEFEKDFSDKLSAATIQSSIGENFEFYDYNPGGNEKVQQYLLRMPLEEVPLDFGSYMESIDIGKNLDAMNFEQDIPIPNLQLNAEQEIDLEILNTMMIGLLAVKGNIGTGPQKVIFTGFSTVSISSGKLTINTASANGTVKLYSASGLTQAGCSTATPIATGTLKSGKVVFDLSGKTLFANETYIDFVDDNSNQEFVGTLNETAKISKVTGLSQDDKTIKLDPVSFKGAGESSPVKKCVFSDDSKLSLNITTPEWKGVTITKNIKLSGGLDLTFSDSETESLKDIIYTNQDIILEPELTLKFSNATIDFTSEPQFELSSDIKGFESVTVKLPEGVKTSFDVKQELPSSASSMVKEIVWNAGSGIEVEYSNTLPAGNDMKMTASSEFIGLNSQTETIDTTDGAEKKTIQFRSAAENKITIDDATKVDFSANLELPDYNETENTITISGVKPGESYKIAMKITPVFNWESITIDTTALNDKDVSGNMAVNFNPKTLLSSLDSMLDPSGNSKISDKIDLSKLELKLFCERPDYESFKNVQFKGKISLGGTSDGGQTLDKDATYILGSKTEEQQLMFSKEPALVKDSKGTVISDLTRVPCVGMDLASTINSISESEKLGLNYSLKLTGTDEKTDLKLTKKDLNNSSKTSLKITAMIILPLELNVTDNYTVDVMKMAGKSFNPDDSSEPDLLGRTDFSSSGGTMEKLMNIIESVSVTYAPSKKPIIGNAEIKIDLDGTGTNFEEKSISINGGIYT
ncbi:MAG: hypothetical protein KIG96_04515, partial [Treponema sp.]|nr:hypothetical protein [Treponema sp.]